MLILYPVTLLNLFISSNSFSVESLEFSIYSVLSLANSGNFTSVWKPLVSFSCLIVVARASKTMLITFGEGDGIFSRRLGRMTK